MHLVVFRVIIPFILFFLNIPSISNAHYELKNCDDVLYKKGGKLLVPIIGEDHIYWYLKNLRKHWQHVANGVFFENKTITVDDYLKLCKQKKYDLINELYNAKELTSNPILQTSMQSLIADIWNYDFSIQGSLESPDLKNVLFWQLQNTNKSMVPKKILKKSFTGFQTLVMGQISELQASTIVPGLVSISDYTYNLLSTEEKQIIRRIKGKNAKWFLDFEIDLVFDSGHSWAEVKSISSLQSHQDLMMRIIDRAERLHAGSLQTTFDPSDLSACTL